MVLYDRLIPPGALDGARPDAELRYVGKEPGRPAVEQEQINEQLVELGRAGRRVVRLKGGDPFVFGRGGEEAEALAAAGVAFEVVPGVTAGVAAPAYAGIPVTHRDAASAVAFVTGHEDPAKDGSALDWDALARFPGTLVFYMGVKNLPLIAERLIGRRPPGDEPAAVVERGTLAGQRTVTGTLGEIASLGRRGGDPAAGGHGGRAGGGAARDARLARAAAAARRAASWSRAPGRRRAGWRRACASSGPTSSRRRRSGSSRCPGRAAPIAPTTWSA